VFDGNPEEYSFWQVPSSILQYNTKSDVTACTDARLCNVVDKCLSGSSLNEDCCAHSPPFAKCAKCKGKSKSKPGKAPIYWLLDSGVSVHFTSDLRDFDSYMPNEDKSYTALTASVREPIEGYGPVTLHFADKDGGLQIITLNPIDYMKKVQTRLISIGMLLNGGCTVRGNAQHITVYKEGKFLLECTPRSADDSIFVIWQNDSRNQKEAFRLNYNIMHRHFVHPSKDVLLQAWEHTEKFPTIDFPQGDQICPGCALGKMPNQAFPKNEKHTQMPFELIHLDLKSFPVESYHKHRYLIVFYDNYTSFA
jgi:hypothetical protein